MILQKKYMSINLSKLTDIKLPHKIQILWNDIRELTSSSKKRDSLKRLSQI